MRPAQDPAHTNVYKSIQKHTNDTDTDTVTEKEKDIDKDIDTETEKETDMRPPLPRAKSEYCIYSMKLRTSHDL